MEVRTHCIFISNPFMIRLDFTKKIIWWSQSHLDSFGLFELMHWLLLQAISFAYLDTKWHTAVWIINWWQALKVGKTVGVSKFTLEKYWLDTVQWMSVFFLNITYDFSEKESFTFNSKHKKNILHLCNTTRPNDTTYLETKLIAMPASLSHVEIRLTFHVVLCCSYIIYRGPF